MSGQNEHAAPSSKTVTVTSVAAAPSDFSDLNYVLRKNNNYVVGQRLAVTAEDAAAMAALENEAAAALSGASEKTSKEQDLLLTSPTMPVKEQHTVSLCPQTLFLYEYLNLSLLLFKAKCRD